MQKVIIAIETRSDDIFIKRICVVEINLKSIWSARTIRIRTRRLFLSIHLLLQELPILYFIICLDFVFFVFVRVALTVSSSSDKTCKTQSLVYMYKFRFFLF